MAARYLQRFAARQQRRYLVRRVFRLRPTLAAARAALFESERVRVMYLMILSHLHTLVKRPRPGDRQAILKALRIVLLECVLDLPHLCSPLHAPGTHADVADRRVHARRGPSFGPGR